jgi:hypothetical protein
MSDVCHCFMRCRDGHIGGGGTGMVFLPCQYGFEGCCRTNPPAVDISALEVIPWAVTATLFAAAGEIPHIEVSVPLPSRAGGPSRWQFFFCPLCFLNPPQSFFFVSSLCDVG